MNWYSQIKIAADSKEQYEPTITSFEERNDLNAEIKKIERIATILAYLRKYVIQNPPHAQQLIKEIADNKIISSYPQLRQWLEWAAEKARDNYSIFSQLCDTALQKIVTEIERLKARRRKFIEKTLPLQIKLWKERSKSD